MGVIHVSAWFSFPVAPIIELSSCHLEIAFTRQVLQSADLSLLQTKHVDHTRIGEIYRVVNREEPYLVLTFNSLAPSYRPTSLFQVKNAQKFASLSREFQIRKAYKTELNVIKSRHQCNRSVGFENSSRFVVY